MKTTVNDFFAPSMAEFFAPSMANYFDHFYLPLDILKPNNGIICIFLDITLICIILLCKHNEYRCYYGHRRR